MEVEFDTPKLEWTVESLNARLKNLKVGEILRIEGLPNSVYHRANGISCTQLKLFMDCPYKYWHKYIDGNYEEESKAYFAFGRAGHTTILEPHKFEAEFMRQPEGMRRDGAEWERLKAKAAKANKEILTAEQWDLQPKLLEALERSDYGRKLTSGGVAEVSYFKRDIETGMVIKARPDYMKGNIIIDLKTSDSAKPSNIDRKFRNLGYDMQDAMYTDVVEADDFCFVVIESSAPFTVTAPVMFDETLKELAHKRYRKALKELQVCYELDVWPIKCPAS